MVHSGTHTNGTSPKQLKWLCATNETITTYLLAQDIVLINQSWLDLEVVVINSESTKTLLASCEATHGLLDRDNSTWSSTKSTW